jgi:hypothetical protein
LYINCSSELNRCVSTEHTRLQDNTTRRGFVNGSSETRLVVAECGADHCDDAAIIAENSTTVIVEPVFHCDGRYHQSCTTTHKEEAALPPSIEDSTNTLDRDDRVFLHYVYVRVAINETFHAERNRKHECNFLPHSRNH